METVIDEAIKIKREVVDKIQEHAEEIGWLVRKEGMPFIENDACQEILRLLNEVTTLVNLQWDSTYKTPTGESFKIKEKGA